MNTVKQPGLVVDDVVVSLEYTLTVDGKVIDTSEGTEPILFIQGRGHIIPGLEKALYGMAAGGKKDLVIQPEDGYGELDGDAFMDVDRKEFPSHIPLDPGITLQMRDEEGNPFDARIDTVNGETIRLDFNHPLAGKELYFSVEVVSLREAAQEELEHDHVHQAGHSH